MKPIKNLLKKIINYKNKVDGKMDNSLDRFKFYKQVEINKGIEDISPKTQEMSDQIKQQTQHFSNLKTNVKK